MTTHDTHARPRLAIGAAAWTAGWWLCAALSVVATLYFLGLF